MLVEFHGLDNLVSLRYSVTVSKYKEGYIFVKHKDRSTWEIPGGHIEDGESPFEAAERELIEETGAMNFVIKEICNYSVNRNNGKSYGRLFYAEIKSFSNKLNFETIEVKSFSELPNKLTYPKIQPYLFKEVLNRLDQT